MTEFDEYDLWLQKTEDKAEEDEKEKKAEKRRRVRFLCTYCNKEFLWLKDIKNHVDVHVNPQGPSLLMRLHNKYESLRGIKPDENKAREMKQKQKPVKDIKLVKFEISEQLFNAVLPHTLDLI